VRHRSRWHRSLVWLWALESIVGCRWSSIRWNKPVGRLHIAAIAVRPRSLHRIYISVGRRESVRCSRICRCALLVKLVIFLALITPTSHANITANSNTTSLLRNDPAQRCAGGQTWELLSAVYGEGYRLDLETEMEECLRGPRLVVGMIDLVGKRQSRVFVGILGIFNFFI
jgi:hypothetical protein